MLPQHTALDKDSMPAANEMTGARARRRGGVLVLVALALHGAGSAAAQEAGTEWPWFGVPAPPGGGEVPAVLVGERGPRPVTLPPGDKPSKELEGATIKADVETIVGFSTQSRREREVGSGQLWGRIAGLPSGARTTGWAADELRKAGVADVRVQPFAQQRGSAFWLPLSWEVSLVGDAAFGAGTMDIVLESAMPLQPSELAGGTLTAPLVFVGNASPALLDRIDVNRKIAVQLVIPQAHMVFERNTVVPRTRDLMKRGAVAVLNIMRQPGNERARDFSNCGGPCFNIGGKDGFFLERVLDRASEAGVEVLARLKLETETRENLEAQNVVAVVPGKSDENIVIDAHVDAWFDGAGDNADGLAVFLALARHFAKPEHKPARTLVFLASAGHHTTGLNGPRAFVAMNAQLASKTLLVLNVEHVAQRNFSLARSVAPDGYRETVADAGEAPIVAGVSNGSPFLDRLFNEGVTRYGVNFVSAASKMESGETGGFSALDVARVTIMQAPSLYHTSGEVADVISAPGLERMARFLTFFIDEAGKAAHDQINP